MIEELRAELRLEHGLKLLTVENNDSIRCAPIPSVQDRSFLHISLDFEPNRGSIEVSPPIQFRIEWADSQGKSPLLGCRPILILVEDLLRPGH